MLTDDEARQFATDGFLCKSGVIGSSEVGELREEFAELLRERVERRISRGSLVPAVRELLSGDFEADLLALASSPHFDSGLLRDLDITLPFAPFSVISHDSLFHVGPGLFDLVRHQGILDLVEGVIGPEISFSGNQHIRLKLPESILNIARGGDGPRSAGEPTPWHTDSLTTVAEAAETPVLTVWIPLADVGPDGGCLRVVPGSHLDPEAVRWPMTPERASALDATAVDLPVPFGSVILMDRRLAHASGPNHSDRVRWSFDLRYFPTSMASDQPWFPSIRVRSAAAPSAVEPDAASWQAKWEDARTSLAESGQPLPGRPEYARLTADALLAQWAEGDYVRA